ncbi:MAG: recombinase zinc beta ribbon domain-containing protein [Pseudomonadota bacterium]
MEPLFFIQFQLALAHAHRIFTSPFYCGIIEYAGKEYEGKHKAMVTPEEFDRVQILLGRKGKPRPKKHKFPFTGLIRCGECGCLYTAETKTKHIKSTGDIRQYTYYHCTRKRKDYDCSQRDVVRAEDLASQIADEINKFTILPEFKDWALDALRKSNDKEIAERSQIHETQTKTILKAQHELDNLTKMRYREQIDDDTFMKEKDLLQGHLRELKGHLRETETRAENWLELTELAFNFATHAREAFIKGDLETKKSILMAIGSNPIIKDGKLTIQASHWLQPIAEGYPALEEEYKRLEPAQLADIKARTEAFASVRSAWLRD